MKHLILFLGLFLWLGVPTGEARELKLAHAVNTQSPYHLGSLEFKKLVEQESKGDLQIRIFPNRQLGDERALIEALQMGLVDLAVISTGPVGNFVPEFLALDVPYVFTSYAQVDRVLEGKLGTKFLSTLNKAKLVGLAFWENGFRHLTNNKHPVLVPQDLVGLKLRTMENRVHIEAFEYLGAIVQPLPYGEALAALKQGVLDGQENPINIIYAFKLYTLQKYLSLTGHVYSPALLLVSQKTWQSLSAQEKSILKSKGLIAAKYEKRLIREQEQNQLEELKKAGMKVFQVDREKFKAYLTPLREKWAESFPWLKEIEAFLQENK